MLYRKAKLNDAGGRLDRQWFVYYYYKHPETGEMVRKRVWISMRIRTATARRNRAHELISEINTKLQSGWNPFAEEQKGLTGISEAIIRMVNLKKATTKKRTWQTYSSVVNIFLKWLEKEKLDQIPVSDFNYKIVQDYFDHCLLHENISARTYNNRLSALRSVFSILEKREYLFKNPFVRVERLAETEPEIIMFNKKELQKIKEELPKFNFQLYVITNLIYYGFIRPAEIVRLKRRHVLWDEGFIVIPGTRTKNKKSRVVIITDAMKKNLENWDLDFPPGHFLFSRHLKPGEKEVAPTRIAEAWHLFAEKFNIDKTIYALKHTGNGMAFDQGLNARDIQLQNGHSSLDQTQKYLNRFRRIASDKFREEFNGY